MLHGFVQPSLGGQDNSQSAQRFDVLWLDLQSPAVSIRGFRQLLQVSQCLAQVVGCLCIIRLEPQGFVIIDHRFAQLALERESDPQAIPDLTLIRGKLQRPLKAFNSLIELILCHQGEAKKGQGFGVFRIGVKNLAVNLFRLSKIA